MNNVIKKGDTFTPLSGVLKDKNGVVDLTPSSSVLLYVRSRSGDVLINGKSMTVVNAGKGEVKYEWEKEDVLVPGVYGYEIVVVWFNGKKTTFPNSGLNNLVIENSVREVSL